ncbi:GNAT family N-acetyltransferase [Caulobacter sp. NIBR2454]|uniref:GNAT family N-acetyltransferase n=1 Tax=Caulobacter sp. NIBR2454 TaxID=3015996 RepID=UPI0022B6E1D3|nr:GNAT family N-acetyltransferase [Caulobacter sp. NIBR2454]
MTYELTHAGYVVSDDQDRIDLDRAHQWIGQESYWAQGIPRATLEKAVRNSLAFGVYAPSGEMAAMARVVTDRATFAWLCDVFVDEAHRGHGLGKAIMRAFTEHPDLQGLRRRHLATADAHGLYAQFGFKPLDGVDRWMEIVDRDVYRR